MTIGDNAELLIKKSYNPNKILRLRLCEMRVLYYGENKYFAYSKAFYNYSRYNIIRT